MNETNDGPHRHIILVIDDNEANRLLAQNTLEDEDYNVVLASNGAAGLVSFEQHQPDCVLLDVRMPEMDGFAVCERIRLLPGGESTPVIFLTALRDVDTFDHALKAGGDDFLTKPVSPAELVVRVQTALKLRRLRIELHEHYDLLKRQRDDLMRVQLQKERLMAFVVHDLKNPVNSMDLHAQLLLRDKSLSERSRQSATQIRSEARQLNRMILNLLDLSKADEGRLEPKRAEVELQAMVADVLLDMEVNAQSRSVRLTSSLEAANVFGEEDLLRRMLTNLIENAIRHAPSGSIVQVRSLEVAGCTEIQVLDTGRGVPQALRDTVFDAFARVEGSATLTDIGGRGLGLTFCKAVALAHGGSIRVEDADPGAKFCVRIPHADT